jgi:hypothetical protein
VSRNDRREPGGVDEVTPLEGYQNFDVVHDCGLEPLLKLIGDGEVQLALHSHFAILGVEIYLADPERTHLH